MESTLHLGDCLTVTKQFDNESIDLVYLDPPFCTQKVQKLTTKDRATEHSFHDKWTSLESYGDFLMQRLREFHRALKPSGSLFFHCDRNAAHIIRLMLDAVFSREMFRSEIIWHYRRWANAQRDLLRGHQTIYSYSKSAAYKFNRIFEPYSSSTNVDQILQMRQRDGHGKTVYARNATGTVVANGNKKGVPLSDVWDIPLLNPKAAERTGYPTQKPVLLLERIIELATEEGDTILDPFCGSGTSLVAAKLMGRKAIGIDVSPQAIKMTKERLTNPTKTDSILLRKGRDSYATADRNALALLEELDIIPIHRNSGIDALLCQDFLKGPVAIRVQRGNESLVDAAFALYKASKTKTAAAMLLIATSNDSPSLLQPDSIIPSEITVIDSTALSVSKVVEVLRARWQKDDAPHNQLCTSRAKG